MDEGSYGMMRPAEAEMMRRAEEEMMMRRAEEDMMMRRAEEDMMMRRGMMRRGGVEAEMHGREEEMIDPAGRPTGFPFGTPIDISPLPIDTPFMDRDLDGDGIPDIIDPSPLDPNRPIHGGAPGSPVYNPPTPTPPMAPSGLPPQPRPELPFTPAGRDPFGVPLDDPDAQPEGEMYGSEGEMMSRPPVDPEMMKKLMMMMKSKMGGM